MKDLAHEISVFIHDTTERRGSVPHDIGLLMLSHLELLGYTPLRLPKEGEPWDYETVVQIEFAKGWQWVFIDEYGVAWRGKISEPYWDSKKKTAFGKGAWSLDHIDVGYEEISVRIAYAWHSKGSLRLKGRENGNV